MPEEQQQVVPAAADGAVAAEGGEGAAGGAARQSTWSMIQTIVMRCLFIYMISSFFKRATTPNTSEPQATAAGGGGGMIPGGGAGGNILPLFTELDMYVYLSENEIMKDFSTSYLLWQKSSLKYGDWSSGSNADGSYSLEENIPVSESLQNNGTLFVHVYFVSVGDEPSLRPKKSKLQLSKAHKVTKYMKRHFTQTVNLLTGESTSPKELQRKLNESKFEIVSHFHPNISINLVVDNTTWMRSHIPHPLDELIEFVPGTNQYYPIVFFNDYWNLRSDYMPLNDTVNNFTIRVEYSPLSLFKLQMYASQQMKKNWLPGFLEDPEQAEDQDTMKRMILETNVYLLGLTIVVSLLHTVFEFLAFKNDIQFWRSRESLEGLSVRSVFFNLVQQLIVFLYVCDNDTNVMVKISIFIGMLIELWKINKVVDISIDTTSGGFPIKIQNKSSYVESSTKQYDQQAFRYLGILLFPMLLCYSVYSMIYNEHKGWYSFVLSMLYGFLLTFGFIMMTPQLFINYKMKSVAHLPWRMLTYKALNTFIDDIFAFVIRMPTLYRLGCLRDDVIFFIYLYQKWIYPVDKSRVNEFGVSGEQLEGKKDEIKENGATIEGDGGETAEETGEKKSMEEKKTD